MTALLDDLEVDSVEFAPYAGGETTAEALAIVDAVSGEYIGPHVGDDFGAAIVSPEHVAQMAIFRERMASADATAANAKAKSTRKCYETDIRDWSSWCEQNGQTAFPAHPEALRIYLQTQLKEAVPKRWQLKPGAEPCDHHDPATVTNCQRRAGKDHTGEHLHQRGLAISTLGRRISAISGFHRKKGVKRNDLPTRDERVSEWFEGAQKAEDRRPVRKKVAIELDDLKELLKPIGMSTTAHIRDRAILLLTFFACCRRSEIAALVLADLEFSDWGLIVKLRRSKTDQTGRGKFKGVPMRPKVATCAVTAVRAWLDHAGIVDPSAPVFRNLVHGKIGASLTAQSIASVVKRHCAIAGLDPNLFGAHSLRSGWITTYAQSGGSDTRGMQQSGHTSFSSWQGYIRKKSVQRDNPNEMIPA